MIVSDIRRKQPREESKGFFEVVLTQPIPNETLRHIPYAAVSHLRCGTFSASFEVAIGHNCCVQHDNLTIPHYFFRPLDRFPGTNQNIPAGSTDSVPLHRWVFSCKDRNTT